MGTTRSTSVVLRRQAVAALGVLTLGLISLIQPARSAAPAASWTLSLRNLGPNPQKTGARVTFEISLGCAAIAAPSCEDGKITIPHDPVIDPDGGFTRFDLHPLIMRVNKSQDRMEAILKPVPAGTTTQMTFSLESFNGTTPDGTVATVRAIVEGANTETKVDETTTAFEAEAELQVKKFLPADAPDGTILPLDEPVRYRVRACDPRSSSSEVPGRLFIQDGSVVDTLPDGARFVAASPDGTYDADTRTVTWSLVDQPAVPCSTSSFNAQYWVELEYPSGPFAAGDSVTNSVAASGRPYGETERITSNHAVTHKLGKPVPEGTFCKGAVGAVPPSVACGAEQAARTWRGPWKSAEWEPGDVPQPSAEASFSLTTKNNAVSPATVDVVDALPCLSNSDGAAVAMYSSNPPGQYCADPAFRVRAIWAGQFTSLSSNGTRTVFGPYAKAADADSAPTYVTPSGEIGRFKLVDTTPTKPPIFGSIRGYLIFVPEKDDVISEVRWNDVPLASGEIGYFNIIGYLDPGLEEGERVHNVARATLHVGASTLNVTSAGRLQAIDDVYAYAFKGSGATASATGPNDTSVFQIRAGALDGSVDSVWDEGLVVTDLLPQGVTSPKVAKIVYDKPGGGSAPLPTSDYVAASIPNYGGTGRTMLRITVAKGVRLNATPLALTIDVRTPGPYPAGSRSNELRVFVPDREIDVCLGGTNSGTTAPAVTSLYMSDTNDWDGDGQTTDGHCRFSNTMNGSGSAPFVRAIKEVKGNLDADYAQFPAVGRFDPSQPGSASYRLTIRNDGNVGAKNLVLYDVFPHPGDTGVSATLADVARRSDFTPELAGAITAPTGWTVEYSHAENPCRPEVGDGSAAWPSGCTSDWSAAVGDAASVTAVRLRQAATGILPTNGSAVFSWTMSVPGSGLPLLSMAPEPGDVAWNTVAFSATRSDNNQKLPTSEPPKVGLAVPQTDVSLAKVADSTEVIVGEAVEYTLTVAHDTVVTTETNGAVSYTDAEGNPTGNIAPATGVVVEDALPDGLDLVDGSAIAQRGTFDPATGRWTVGTLQPGESATLKYRAAVERAGTFANRAEVTANGVRDADSEPGNCIGGPNAEPEDDCKTVTVNTVAPAISLRKLVESRPGSEEFIEAERGSEEPGIFPSGKPVPYRFVVENTGEVALTDVAITDEKLPDSCTDEFAVGGLAIGETKTVTCEWPVGWGVGTTLNTAKVSGRPRTGPPVTDEDDAEVFVPSPAVTLEKSTNGEDADTAEDAVAVDVNDPITWTYVVTNSGSDDLVDIALVDDRQAEVALDEGRCERSEGDWGAPLPPEATITCTFTGTAKYGFYANVGTATAKGRVTPIEVTDADPSNYLAPSPDPSITIEKYTNGVDADVPDDYPEISEGEPVEWRYVIVNDGNEPLADLVLADDEQGNVSLTEDNCERSAGTWGDVLQTGDSITCTFSDVAGTATYTNLGTVTAKSTETQTDVTDDDPSGYEWLEQLTAAEVLAAETTAGDDGSPSRGRVDGEREPRPGAELPKTGMDIGRLVLIALAMLAAGIGMQRVRPQTVESRAPVELRPHMRAVLNEVSWFFGGIFRWPGRFGRGP